MTRFLLKFLQPFFVGFFVVFYLHSQAFVILLVFIVLSGVAEWTRRLFFNVQLFCWSPFQGAGSHVLSWIPPEVIEASSTSVYMYLWIT